MLTGETLFDAPNEVALVTAHLTHDGVPPPVKRLAERPATAQLAAALRRCLRKAPSKRGTAAEMRAELAQVGAGLAGEELAGAGVT